MLAYKQTRGWVGMHSLLPPERTGLRPGSETILVVEDEEQVRALVRAILERNGYAVISAGNGMEALSVSGRHEGKIHLLLTDVIMPGMNGAELARKITPSRPGMKILFMSGYTDDAILRHGVLNPGTEFIEKPFSPDSLARKVRRVLDAGEA